MANWLHHNICNKDQIMAIMKKMATIVDKQNSGDKNYKPMSSNFETSIAFLAACDLIFKGRVQPSGYTEPLLHKRRLEKK
jgi:malate synthase